MLSAAHPKRFHNDLYESVVYVWVCSDLDLEALRAAERSHAEARLRAVVDDIKDRAMKDVTQRMTLTSQRSTFPKQKSAVFADEMQRHGSVHHQQLNNMQAMQHFASKSAVSDIVSHLRTSSNMSNTARSSTHLKNMHMGRPPKDAGHIIHALQPTLLHTGSSLLPQTPRSPSRLGAGMTPKKLMRLTSCVKLERQESA